MMNLCQQLLQGMCFSLLMLGIGTQLLLGQDVQIELEGTQQIYQISPSLARKANLFSEYEDFERAWVFEIEENQYQLEVYYEQDGLLLRDRIPLTPAELASLQESLRVDLQVITAPSSSLPGSEELEEGRLGYLVNSTILSTGFYSWAIPVSLDVSEPRAGVGLGLIAASAGFFVPLLATRDKFVSKGMRDMHMYGGTRGILHGLAIVGASNPNASGRSALFAGLATSITESYIGYNLAKKHNWNQATTSMIGFGGDLGASFGLITAGIISANNEDSDVTTQTLSLLGLAGSAGGLVVGHTLSRAGHITQGDVRAWRSAAMVGTWIPFSIYLTQDNIENPRSAFWTLLAGGAIATTGGYYLTRNTNFSPKQGTLIELGSIGGGGLGAGLGYLVGGNNPGDAVLVSSAIGAATSHLILYNFFKNRPHGTEDHADLSFHLTTQTPGLAHLPTDAQKNAWIPRLALTYQW